MIWESLSMLCHIMPLWKALKEPKRLYICFPEILVLNLGRMCSHSWIQGQRKSLGFVPQIYVPSGHFEQHHLVEKIVLIGHQLKRFPPSPLYWNTNRFSKSHISVTWSFRYSAFTMQQKHHISKDQIFADCTDKVELCDIKFKHNQCRVSKILGMNLPSLVFD